MLKYRPATGELEGNADGKLEGISDGELEGTSDGAKLLGARLGTVEGAAVGRELEGLVVVGAELVGAVEGISKRFSQLLVLQDSLQ